MFYWRLDLRNLASNTWLGACNQVIQVKFSQEAKNEVSFDEV